MAHLFVAHHIHCRSCNATRQESSHNPSHHVTYQSTSSTPTTKPTPSSHTSHPINNLDRTARPYHYCKPTVEDADEDDDERGASNTQLADHDYEPVLQTAAPKFSKNAGPAQQNGAAETGSGYTITRRDTFHPIEALTAQLRSEQEVGDGEPPRDTNVEKMKTKARASQKAAASPVGRRKWKSRRE